MRAETERRLAPLTVAAVVLVVIAVVWGVLRVASPAGPGGPPVTGAEAADPRYHLAPGTHLSHRHQSAPVRRLAPADVA
ncbi:MAG: hypothetical protein QOF85_2720, partial [Solirubrobacterales bacterium]|nr:hypothetical protein [Solirubrobacterales bacterium]